MSTALPPASEQPVVSEPVQLKLSADDILASGRRLWLRGRLTGLHPPVPPGWYGRWWGRSGSVPPRVAHLDTRIGGTILEADVPLSLDGRFEALFTAELPPARRGWRLARNKLTCDGAIAEGCGVVLSAPHDAAGAIVVVLPVSCTYPEGGVGLLQRLESARPLASLLRRLTAGPDGHRPIYYLGAGPTEGDGRQREVALAITALGWPAGSVVLLPGPSAVVVEPLMEGLDRLRWLFAGTLDLTVINLESSAADLLKAKAAPAEDRATVQQIVNPGDDPRTALNGHAGSFRLLSVGLRPTRSGRVTRYPLVFCHGMLALSTLRGQLPVDLNYFVLMREFLKQRGFRALFPEVLPTGGIVARAAQLRDQILRWTDEPVNLIAHSMGGLDARYLVSRLDMGSRVRSLTTVATPHRGTYLAEWFIANFRNRVPLLLAMEVMGMNVDGFRDLTRAAARQFNANTPDVPGVTYFSYGGDVPQAKVSPVLRRAWALLWPVEGPNDGMVSVASSRWGEFLGTVPADHFAQTPDAMFVRPGEDFDSLGFFTRLIEDLAYRGF